MSAPRYGWVLALLCAAGPWTVALGGDCEPWAGKLISVQGSVETRRAQAKDWRPAAHGDTLCGGDTLTVGERSRAGVLMPNETILRLDQLTTLSFPTPPPVESTFLDLLKGAAYFFSRVPRMLTIKTPFINAGVEGTEFLVEVDARQATISVFEGIVVAENPLGAVRLKSGESAVARAGEAPSKGVLVQPQDAVQWTLYYPPVIEMHPDRALDSFRASVRAFDAGDLGAAFSRLEAVPEGSRDGRFYAYRASLLLHVGRVDEAREDLDKSASLDPGNAEAMALRSVIAVAENDKEGALELAQRARKMAPRSSVSYLALSYAYQSAFDLENALDAVTRATELAADDALAWARLAELRLSFGHLDEALEAAQTAVSLNPRLSRTQTILGFAYLTRIDIDAAQASLEKAIQLDQADPLPRLALGLAKIRHNALQEGRRDIEIAASLDPRNSLVRSYLGKAYFEEKRDRLAATAFDTAKQLDPNDPTPWFYDAIRKQTVNRPVEALRDLRKSIELNDNRAVYRSRLLLDDDLAARSASLGRIFTDLGFEQLALVEGWKSVNTDPSNYSGHRLLADTYAALPRHEIARASELLQAQLLQPLNLTPLQPQLAETNLVLLGGAGPSALSFSEFNPLFTRDRVALQATGVVGNNDTWGNDAVLSGQKGKVSASLGQFHYQSDGFRTNNDVQQDAFNVFLQSAITPSLNLQAEYRKRTTDQGDLALNFDPTDFSSDQRRDIEQETVRIGARYSPLTGSTFLASGFYTDRDENNNNFGGFRDLQDGYQAEAQYLFLQNALTTTLGGGLYAVNRDVRIPSRPDVDPDLDAEHSNAYVYAGITWPETATWTLGVSYDSFERGDFDRNRLNPKIGLQWDVAPSIGLRAAYLRTLKRVLAVNQTIEPTQVAGFNQFFDDNNGTQTERYGIGLDVSFTEDLSGGVEFSHRDLEVPLLFLSGRPTITVDRSEDLARAYLYWTPHPRWSLSGEAAFEHFERSAQDLSVVQAGAPSEVETLMFPLAARYYHPSGLFAGLGGTFVRQDVELAPGSTITQEGDEFFLVDAAIGFRLPKRRGILSLEARNLLDEEFLFQDLNVQTARTEGVSPRFAPDRSVFLRATIVLD